MANQRRSGRFSSGPKRRTTWEGAAFDANIANGVSFVSTVVSEAILENVPNPTVVRIRGRVHIVGTAIGAAFARTQVAMGIYVADSKAITAGITALELPFTGIGSDWMWWDTAILESNTSVSPPSVDNLGSHFDIEIDNKAMRKIQPNQALVFVAENNALNSTLTVQVSGVVRVLLKT